MSANTKTSSAAPTGADTKEDVSKPAFQRKLTPIVTRAGRSLSQFAFDTAKRFTGKVFFVSGASSGVGRCTAKALAHQGAHVWLAARREDKLMEVKKEIVDAGGEATVYRLDITSAKCVKECIKEIVEIHGKLDGAFNNAGCKPSFHAIFDEDFATEIDQLYSVYVKGLMNCLTPQLAVMRSQGFGSIVNHLSVMNSQVAKGYGALSATHAAAASLTKTAALEAVSRGVRVNSISSSYVEPSEMVDRSIVEMAERFGVSKTEARNTILQVVPQRRFLGANEVASTVAFLLDDDAPGITGQDIRICGGTSIHRTELAITPHMMEQMEEEERLKQAMLNLQ